MTLYLYALSRTLELSVKTLLWLVPASSALIINKYFFSLDEIVENVRAVSEATDTIMEEERDRQTEAMRTCMQLLDSSVEHYENLILLRDDLRFRTKPQYPPVIELSSSEF